MWKILPLLTLSNCILLVFFSAPSCIFSQDAPRSEEQSWYLISETELSSIERYAEKSEAEKRSWLSQAQKLKTQSENSLKESETLNVQLADQRKLNLKLEQSFNESEREWLKTLSSKNGEINELKLKAAEKTLETAKYKGKADQRLIIIIALAAAIVGYVVIRILRFFKIIAI